MKAKAAVRLRSYAKINFALNVTGTRGGYHLLDSVLASVDLYDTVTARPRKDGLINVYMQGLGSEHIPPEQNNAVRAGEAFVSAFGTCGADIRILKDIPMGAGLGGSSADAAGVLNALARLYGVEDRQALKALALGATAVCVGRALIPPIRENGPEGARQTIARISAELRGALARTGAAELSALDASVLRRVRS